MLSKINKLERSIGGLKFAVIIISVFALIMIIGTFIESYYGTEFANRFIYKSLPFMFVQFLLFSSILLATFLRLPPQKRLYGFYLIHSSLITIGIGSFITYTAGIDGTIHLPPMTPVREIVLNEDIVKISIPDKGIESTTKMPYTPFSKDIRLQYKDIIIKRFIPFSEKKLKWVKSKKIENSSHSSTYFISNSNVSEEFTLSIHPDVQDFKASLSLGPLNVNYLPQQMSRCFSLINPSKLIIWNSKTSKCFTPKEMKVKINKTKTNKRFLVIKDKQQMLSFLPDLSPWALDSDFKPMQSDFKVFSKKFFEDSPSLFLFGEEIAYFDQDKEEWNVKSFKNKESIKLPWMNFGLRLIKHSSNEYPSIIPIEVLPIQKKGQLIRGNTKAVLVEIRAENYWILDDRPLSLLIDGVKHNIYLTKNSKLLPFELTLTRFKMDKNPGTNTPASYESFINLFSKKGNFDHHIYMNNPLKYDDFTLYQASYSQDPKTKRYSSTLSVNIDQGRPFKYLGSIFLIIGAIWHHHLNSKKVKKRKEEITSSSRKNYNFWSK